MDTLIVLAHPERHSFNGALADRAIGTLQAAGHTVLLDDLYRDGFDPVERASNYPLDSDADRFAALTVQRTNYERGSLPDDVQREIARLEWADLVIFQFPLWWHAQPAMLKGWFDRVLVYGGLYSGSMRYDRGYFRGKRAICSVTTGSPEPAFQPFGRAGNMVDWLWPIHSSLYYVGYDVLAPQVSYGVQGGGIQYEQEAVFRAKLETMQEAWSARLAGLGQESPIPFSTWDDWNDQGVLKHNHPLRWRLA